MLPKNQFKSYRPGVDIYADRPAHLRMDDLPKRFDGSIKLSYLISTYNRQYQLARSLETLCRQDFREFEVLLMDDGSTQNIRGIVDQFVPYLNITLFRQEKTEWYSCPSRAYKAMLPEAKGDVVAIAHPEMMLGSLATQYLYYGARLRLPNDAVNTYVVGRPEITSSDNYWVSLKSLYVIEDQYDALDRTDWHSDTDNIRSIPGFWSTVGFAGRANSWHSIQIQYPWWFVGSAPVDSPIWRDLPTFDGHAIIDMWMVAYRNKNAIMDVVPTNEFVYHQPHLVTAVGLEGEQEYYEKQ